MMTSAVAISILQQVITYAPEIEHVISEVPDLVAKGESLLADFKKMNFSAMVTDAESIAGDLGISQQTLAKIIGHATVSAPPAPAVAAK